MQQMKKQLALSPASSARLASVSSDAWRSLASSCASSRTSVGMACFSISACRPACEVLTSAMCTVSRKITDLRWLSSVAISMSSTSSSTASRMIASCIDSL